MKDIKIGTKVRFLIGNAGCIGAVENVTANAEYKHGYSYRECIEKGWFTYSIVYTPIGGEKGLWRLIEISSNMVEAFGIAVIDDAEYKLALRLPAELAAEKQD